MAEVNLRPMTVGEVLDRTFSLYKNNFWLFVGISALPFLLLFIFQVGVSAVNSSKIQTAGPAASAGLLAGAVGGIVIGGILYLALIGATQAATVFAVSELYLGGQPTVRGAYSRVGAKAFRVLLVLFLVGLAVGVGFILLIVPGFILACRTAISVPVSMLEDTNAVRSVERSMELTKGFGWQMFLIFLLVWVISYVAALLLQFPFIFLAGAAAVAHHQVSFGIQVLQHLAEFISQVLVGPIGTIAFSLMYYNLRVRKEAFDIQHLMNSLGQTPEPGAPSIA